MNPVICLVEGRVVFVIDLIRLRETPPSTNLTDLNILPNVVVFRVVSFAQ
jgi:hypothetical protein